MAVAIDAVDGGASGSSTITSAGASPNGSDRLMLVVATGRSAAVDVKSGGSGGTSLTKISSDFSLFFGAFAGNVWALPTPGPSGSTQAYVDFGSGDSSAFSVLYLEGVNQASPYTSGQSSNADASSAPSLSLTGLTPGQDVRAAVMVGNIPNNITTLTPNGSTTVDRTDAGPTPGSERQSLTFWVSGVADGSGNVTLGGTLGPSPDVPNWAMFGFGVNAAAGGSSVFNPLTGRGGAAALPLAA